MLLKTAIAALLLSLSLEASWHHDRYDHHGYHGVNHHRPSARPHHDHYRPQNHYGYKPHYVTHRPYKPTKVIHHHVSHDRFDAADAVIIGTTLGIIIGSQLSN
ncbi:MAG: hypothetical protein JXK05_01765 [Campylobacterales bacterium]|nr:hypothetical protein [Campylobacterales bacterium]